MTHKQKVFCEQYVLLHGNAAASARAAGYNCTSDNTFRQVGAENLTKPYIAEYIEELRKRIEKEFAVTAEEVIGGLRKARDRAFSDVPVLDREGEEIGEYKNDLNSAIRASELLGKTIGIFIDKSELSGPNGTPLEPTVIYLPAKGSV